MGYLNYFSLKKMNYLKKKTLNENSQNKVLDCTESCHFSINFLFDLKIQQKIFLKHFFFFNLLMENEEEEIILSSQF